jgi:uncharacterized MAPEG superfamily protein
MTKWGFLARAKEVRMNDLIAQPSVRLFMLCAAILTLKMIAVGSATGLRRILRGVYISPEDFVFAGKTPGGRDDQIERLRRAHQNDLENILPFFVVGFLYALTAPSYAVAWWLFWTFTVARVLHTVCYALSLQPWRTIIFEVGNVVLLITTVLLLVRAL